MTYTPMTDLMGLFLLVFIVLVIVLWLEQRLTMDRGNVLSERYKNLYRLKKLEDQLQKRGIEFKDLIAVEKRARIKEKEIDLQEIDEEFKEEEK